jgi:glutamate racemase
MTIGVFDSGVGGLTLLAALRRALPQADLLYLGDTARVPYGPRGAETVARYAAECAEFLVARGCEHIVVACNTASAFGADAVRAAVGPIPVDEVVGAGVAAAVAHGAETGVAVLATRGTVKSGAYTRALAAALPSVPVRSVACPLLVPMIEEGWYDHMALKLVVDEYLAELDGFDFDTLILGCTHYPLIRELIEDRMGDSVAVLDASQVLVERLADRGLARPGSGRTDLAFTDDPALSVHATRRIYSAEITSLEQVVLRG